MKNFFARKRVSVLISILLVLLLAGLIYIGATNDSTDQNNSTPNTEQTATTNTEREERSDVIRLRGQFVEQVCIQDGPGCNTIEFLTNNGRTWKLAETTEEIIESSSGGESVTIEAEVIDERMLQVVTIKSSDAE